MNYGEKENRRVKSQIVEGLFELMADYDYHTITITQLSKQPIVTIVIFITRKTLFLTISETF